MARIAGVDLPKQKRVEIALTYIYGIGRSTSCEILSKINIDPNTKTDDLTESQINDIRKVIDGAYKVEIDYVYLYTLDRDVSPEREHEDVVWQVCTHAVRDESPGHWRTGEICNR